MRAPLVGLKTCLPPTRSRNFEPTASAAPAAAHARSSVRSSRHSDSAEISALFAPDHPGVPVRQSPRRCTTSALAMVTAACAAAMSKSSCQTP